MGIDGQSWHLDLNYDQRVAQPVSSQRPAPRYKHAAMVFNEKLYVTGGTRNGRYVSAFQVFDLKNLTWSKIKLNMEAIDKDGTQLEVFPATSGHNMFIDLESYDCGVVETSGNIPVARSGQSVTLFGSKLIMFGGEDGNRRPLNDVHVLDLETMTWSAVETTQTRPTPRLDHAAALYAERYLFIFGGCSHSVFFNDLHVLDLETGISISSASLGGGNFLLTFGGYNGMYYNEVFAMRVKPRDSLQPKILQSPAAAAAAASVTAAYALAKTEMFDFTEKEDLNSKAIQVDTTQQNLSIELNSIREEKKALELSLAEYIAENSAIKSKIEEMNGSYAELSKELHSVPGQLVAERSRCAKREAQIGELHKMLESMASLEEEVQKIRREKSAFESDMEHSAVQKRLSGAIWKWVAG